MATRNINPWWTDYEHLSDVITPENLSGLMEIWNGWRKKGHRLYFRGEGDCIDRYTGKPYPLQPNLLRPHTYKRLMSEWNVKTPCELERKIFDRYKRYSAHLIEDDTAFAGRSLQELEMLCLSQHFGLPTRLLDWSMNPYVALYFSLVGEGNYLEDTPCRLWVMVLKDEKVRRERTIHLENNTEYEDHEDVITLNVLNAEKSKKDQRDKFLKGPYIVVPLVFTKRIAAQSGRFVYCPHLKNDKDRLDKCVTQHIFNKKLQKNGNNHSSHGNRLPDVPWRLDEHTDNYNKLEAGTKNSPEVPWERLICYPVSNLKTVDGIYHKDILLRTLEFSEYHSGRLFPDLSGWAKYIRYGFK